MALLENMRVFVRVVDALAVTGTFKHQKAQYQRDGFDPTLGNIYWRDPATARYGPLDAATYSRILSGDIRL